MNSVKVNNLSFSYKGSDTKIFNDVNMSVDAGEFVCLLGPSGCGKSTLLRLLAGLEKPSTGNITIGGEPIKGASLTKGVVFQDYGLFPWMTAGENIVLALEQKYPDVGKNKLKEITEDMLIRVGLDKKVFDKLPKELSGGMKQRCAIARAFAIDPPVLLMDEPFGSLDAVTRAKLQNLIIELWSQAEPKKTVFFVTHDVDEALILSEKIYVLGQVGSDIIFEVNVEDHQRLKRGERYREATTDLRNELMYYINLDVTSRITD